MTDIPPSIELAWGLRAAGTRGPKPGLSLERIVTAGIEVAAGEGLEALSMARVAARLDVGTMSLYRYVAAKDELLTLMVDAALGTPPMAEDPEDDWRAGLTAWATGVHDAYGRHPWALRVPISAPPLGPNNVAWLEHALRSLAVTRLSEQQKLSTVLMLSGFVRSASTLTADMTANGTAPTPPAYGSMLRGLIDAERFPALHRAVESGALDDDEGLDAEFHFGLERILDGVEAMIAAQPQ
jgi:AcrR family transcriptional regulator